ncbi:MAG: hypothetical protein ACM3VS_04180 [Candidatus Dadabacteria bacterium]
MKTLTYLLLLVLMPFLSIAQRNNTLITVALAADFPKNTHVLGGHFTINGEVSPDVYLGAGIGISEFQHDDNLYVPLYANFIFLPSTRRSNVKLLVNLSPGYGIYNRSYRIGQLAYKTTGGFYFFGGIGVMGMGRVKPFMAIGYARYGFNDHGASYGSDAVALRMGIGI